MPLVVGEDEAAWRLSEALARGVFAQAIRPPTVPAGASRLRLTVMASHTASDLHIAARALGEAARALGLDPAAMTPGLVERQLEHEHEQAELARIDALAEPSPYARGSYERQYRRALRRPRRARVPGRRSVRPRARRRARGEGGRASSRRPRRKRAV